jgi:hypothetical protein
VIDAAREEIKRIRTGAEAEIANSNTLIAKLRSKIGVVEQSVDVNAVVAAESPKIEAANAKINALTEEKYALEAENRKLEAEVGPIKYVAELIYGSADKTLLEAAVRWMILLLVAVFDPLAIILTMAAITGLAMRDDKDDVMSFFANGRAIAKDLDEAERTREMTERLDGMEKQRDTQDAAQPEDQSTPAEDQKKKLTEATEPEIVYVEKIVEVEKPVEIIKTVEVPVEIIVEKIVEIPVEKVIERTLEDPKTGELADEVQRLLAELESKDRELEFRSRSSNIREAIAASADDVIGNIGTASFGTSWPSNPARGDLFLKVDVKPNILYKWNNRKWIQIDKGRVDDTLAYDPNYIDHLIQEVRKGHRDYEDLSDIERRQIMARIRGGNES